MTRQIIIYKQDNGIPAICIPSPECLKTRSIYEIAVKDVPAGKPFAIVNVSEILALNGIPQETWEVSEADLTDGVGGDSNEFN